MAIDTRQKRFNMLYAASPVAWSPHFEADGAVDADDRAHLLHLYGGNSFEAVTTSGSSAGGGGLAKKPPAKDNARKRMLAEEEEMLEILSLLIWMN